MQNNSNEKTIFQKIKESKMYQRLLAIGIPTEVETVYKSLLNIKKLCSKQSGCTGCPMFNDKDNSCYIHSSRSKPKDWSVSKKTVESISIENENVKSENDNISNGDLNDG